MMERVAETLAGRADYVHLWPFTRRARLGRSCGCRGELRREPVPVRRARRGRHGAGTVA
jgi:predicted AAA+ superfamily ATPase